MNIYVHIYIFLCLKLSSNFLSRILTSRSPRLIQQPSIHSSSSSSPSLIITNTQAIMTGMVACTVGSGIITTYIRSLGEDFGGSSTGQPRTTAYDWRDETKKYLKAQKSNPIRNKDGREFQA